MRFDAVMGDSRKWVQNRNTVVIGIRTCMTRSGIATNEWRNPRERNEFGCNYWIG